MPLICDLYVDKRSFLHTLDPRVKFAGIIVGMIISFLLTNLLWVFTYYVGLVAILLSGRVGMRKYLYAARLMLPVTILVILLWPIFYPGGEPILVKWGFLRISLPSLIQGTTLAVRVNCLAILAHTFLYTTTQRKMVRGLVKLGLPYKYGLMLSLSLRYIPTFGSIICMVMEAQKARGLELEKGNFFHRIKRHVAVLAPTVITALRMADSLAIALDSRAFGAPTKRTYLIDLEVKQADIITLFLLLSALGLVLLIRFWANLSI